MSVNRPAHRGFLPRLAAELVDVLASWLLAVAVGGVAVVAGLALGVEALVVLGVLLGLFAGVAYWVVLHAYGRQTLGKRLIGGVVVDTAYLPISYRRALVRLIAEIVSALPFNLGYLWCAWDAQQQTFHDKIAGTYVIDIHTLPSRTASAA